MRKPIVGLVAAAFLAAMVVPVALSQMESPQTVYTFVSQFQVPRANWAQYAEDTEKNFVPIAEKLMADGAIIGYSTFENVVHTPEGYTHGAAWSSTSLAGLTRVLDEVRKGSPRPGQIASTKHEDLVMQSTTHRASAGHGTSGYLRVVCAMAKPDRPEDYTAGLKKYLLPTFDEEFTKGVVTSYAIESQYVNTLPPSMRCVVATFPNAEGMDKWAAAINSTFGKMSQSDREAFFSTTVPDSRRDFLSRLTHYAHK
ncbi:MAG TPA: hypothetical protein VF758_02860 [Candidatus Acidoferrum sp.]